MKKKSAKEVKRPQDLREGNIRQLFRLLSEQESYTINELAAEMNLSRTAVQNIMARLKQYGIAAESGKRSSNPQGGKRPVSFALLADYRYSVFVILSTSEIYIQVSDFLGNKVASGFVDVSGMSYEDMIALLKTEILDMLHQHALSMERLFGIVMTVSGTVDSESGTILSFTGTNNPGKWGENIPVVSDLRAALGFDGEIVIDALCAFSGYSCYSSLPAKDRADTCLYIMAHRLGIGAAYIRNGVIDKGAHGFLGEVGHLQLDAGSTAVCRCGRTGCFEAMLYPETIRERVNGDERLKAAGIESIEELMLRANEGHVRAQEEVRKIGALFAQLIYNEQLMTDPDCVILHDAYVVPCPSFREAIVETCRKKSEGFFSVPIDLHIDERDFIAAVRSGAVAYLRRSYINHFQEEE